MNSVKNIVYVTGVARSGTSWIAQIINSNPNVKFRFQPFFSYEFKNRVNEDSDTRELNKFIAELVAKDTSFLSQIEKQKSREYPEFIKNEQIDTLLIKENRYQSMVEPLLRKVNNLKVVGIIRHPCAVLNSWTKNAKEFPPDANILNEWRFGKCKNIDNGDYFGFYKWKEVANNYIDLSTKYQDRFKLLRYEDMVKSPELVTKSIFSFLNLDYLKQTEDFIFESTSLHHESYYSVYKNRGQIESWRQDFPNHIIEEIYEDLRDTRLQQFLL